MLNARYKISLVLFPEMRYNNENYDPSCKGGCCMIRLSTDKGAIAVDSSVYTNIAGVAASNCFGVKGMAVRSMTDGLVHLLRREAMSKGVLVTFNDDKSISIDLHIVIDHGVNITAVSNAIIDEVRYVVTKSTGAEVKAVNVFVDSMTVD